jgi:Rrf2 family transcriptional regulator, iron-sulfur cluster assembly transcription factor
MKLTTKGRFAVTAMLDLAIHSARGQVTLAQIAERQNISQAYLEQLFGKLRRGGVVESVRGPGGGYKLSRPAHSLSVAEIITSVEEPIDSTQCGGKVNCLGEKRCMTHQLWENLNSTVQNYLQSVTLADLAKPATAETAQIMAMPTNLKKTAALKSAVLQQVI